jgi:hypothetical protein
MNRMEQMHKHFEDLIKQYGWASHYVPLDEYHINYHTHGLFKNYGHYNLQITLPLDMESAHGVVGRIIKDIKIGKKFEEDIEYLGYLKEGYPIKFKMFMECDRPVLRVILCDQNKLMPEDENCDEYYKRQLDVLEELEDLN